MKQEEDDIKNEDMAEENMSQACDNETSADAGESDAKAEETEEISLEKQLELAKEKIEELNDKYLRQAAEFDNYRKRVMREKAELIKNGGEKVISSILPVLDDLERAEANMDRANDIEAVKEGVRLIIEKFEKQLKHEGLEKIDAVGKDFDVDFHEAVAMVPGQPDEMKGKVIDCLTTGYKLNDKVIRHAKVAVAQ